MNKTLSNEITALQQRNQRVEADKAWEISKTRRIMILCITYILALLVMLTIGVDQAYLNALIPTLGFFLSTLSLDWVKKIWLSKIYNKT